MNRQSRIDCRRLDRRRVLSDKIQTFLERLHRRPTLAVAPLVRAALVVALHKRVQIALDLIKARVERLAKGDLVKLILDRLVELLRAAVRLRMVGLSF